MNKKIHYFSYNQGEVLEVYDETPLREKDDHSKIYYVKDYKSNKVQIYDPEVFVNGNWVQGWFETQPKTIEFKLTIASFSHKPNHEIKRDLLQLLSQKFSEREVKDELDLWTWDLELINTFTKEEKE